MANPLALALAQPAQGRLRRIESALGIDAFDYYGLAEIGPTFASECEEKAGLHFAEDHVLVAWKRA